MNPQYLPPQQLGGPPQGFAPNRMSPGLGTQTFQNVPLGPPKPGQMPSGPMQGGAPPTHSPSGGAGAPLSGNMGPIGQMHSSGPMPNMGGPPPKSQIPSSQLPPAQMPHSQLPPSQLPPSQLPPLQGQAPPDQRNTATPQNNPFGPPPSKPGLADLPPASVQNGALQFPEWSPTHSEWPSLGALLTQLPPSTHQNNPPLTFAPPPQNSLQGSHTQNQFTQPPLPGGPAPVNQNMPPRPGLNQQSQFMQPPGGAIPGSNQPPLNQYQQPPLPTGAPSGPPSGPNYPPVGQYGQPPLPGGPPPGNQYGHPAAQGDLQPVRISPILPFPEAP
ncbi:hypothetical protein NQ318_011883 [Aromia moschata]|uniref:Uncharacterized protein n=1 Tax=Aromia moschata TaxID=1265417 RepID=A0AAV8XW21_9CUCU|nr:hypothetical protein NQ318_011883 [Aromia moschata]